MVLAWFFLGGLLLGLLLISCNSGKTAVSVPKTFLPMSA